MKLRWRLLAGLLVLLFLSVLVLAALFSFGNLREELGTEGGISLSALPTPVLLLFCFPLLAVLIAALVLLRSLAKMRRRIRRDEEEREREEEKGEHL